MYPRLSARQRGYTTQWDKAAKAFKTAHPLCRLCEEAGIITATFAVDHIVPHRGDMELFWDENNWQSLCQTHHNATKQSEERRGFSSAIGIDGWPLDEAHPANTGILPPKPIGTTKSHPVWFRRVFVPLTIVCGAPGSGKSTYVRNNASPDDRVICFDQIATKLFGKGQQRAHASLTGEQVGDVLRARNEMIADLMWEKAASKWPAAWLIVSEAKATHRQWWQDKVGPKTIAVMLTPPDICKARVLADDKAGDVRSSNTTNVIDKWWRDYSPRQGDCIAQ